MVDRLNERIKPFLHQIEIGAVRRSHILRDVISNKQTHQWIYKTQTLVVEKHAWQVLLLKVYDILFPMVGNAVIVHAKVVLRTRNTKRTDFQEPNKISLEFKMCC